MVFKASKVRRRKAPEPVGMGTQLVPSAAVRDWYSGELRRLVLAMFKDYRRVIDDALAHADVKEFFAEDASPTSIFKKKMNGLNVKWHTIFAGQSREVANKFITKADAHSRVTTFASLSAAGLESPKTTYNDNIKQTLGASLEFNSTLITNIQAEAHEQIHSAVMASLSSPNPDEQGQQGIINAVNKIEGMTKARAELIARDQNSKVYSALNTERMQQNGVSKFKWIHSSAGKVPRQSHLDRDGKIYAHDDPDLWTGPKGDQGPPGWAINCRCRAVPVLFDEH